MSCHHLALRRVHFRRAPDRRAIYMRGSPLSIGFSVFAHYSPVFCTRVLHMKALHTLLYFLICGFVETDSGMDGSARDQEGK